MEKPMKTWRVRGPSGIMETLAVSEKKAKANFRWRLVTECHMSRYAATSYDLSDIKKID